jgi:hypothetical protein
LREIVPTRFYKNAICALRLAWAAIFVLLLSASCCYSADVVFIRSPGGSSAEQEQLETATRFYGLNLKVILTSSTNDDLAFTRAIEREEIVGVAIAADALASLHKDTFLRSLQRRQGNSLPLLILGVAPGVDTKLLTAWSGGAASGCSHLDSLVSPEYIFGRVDGFTGQLTNLEIPLAVKDVFYLQPGENSAAQSITSVRHGQQDSPVFIETTLHQQKVFVACATPPEQGLKDGQGVVDAFLQIAPAMMFIKHCGGEQGWHAPHQYANLTIDDPWLRQPYGHVDYKDLFEEMQRHNFHTTIAFIPWNFDRSDPEVVSLFRNHPDRFSITVHGDNHDHKEFTDYRSKPLAVQIADLKQSLARMEKFRALTGIPYDEVMVFPHSIAPEGTLGALKTYNYLATVNSTNVPQDAVRPVDLSFALRPVTLSFAGFPSISRYSVAAPIPNSYIAINEFLGNPLLFYGHSEDFAKGLGAFDGVADEVNELEPGTQWRGLGDIVKHFYLTKLRDDSNYDVLAFSSNICLDNSSGRDAISYVRKQEIGGQTINSVTVDGQKFQYQLHDDYLYFSVLVPAGKTRCAAIEYRNDLELASIGTSKNSVIVYLLRMASDFRDNYVSKSTFGLAFIRFYNQHEVKPAQVLALAFGLILICLFASYRLLGFITRRHTVLRAAQQMDR